MWVSLYCKVGAQRCHSNGCVKFEFYIKKHDIRTINFVQILTKNIYIYTKLKETLFTYFLIPV